MGRKEKAILNNANLHKIKAFAEAKGIAELAEIRPSLITIDLTWNCNFDCQECIDSVARDNSPVVRKMQGYENKNKPTPFEPDLSVCLGPTLKIIAAKNIINYAANKENGVRGLQIMGGESLMFPEINEILNLIAENNIGVELITNGTLILDHLDALYKAFSTPGSSIRVSINGWESYSQRTGFGNYRSEGEQARDKMIEGVRQLSQRFIDKDKKPPIFISTVAFETTIPDIISIAEKVAGANINSLFVLRPRQAISKELKDISYIDLPSLSKICKEATAAGKQLNPSFEAILSENLLVVSEPQPKTYQPCPSTFFKAVVGADGWIYLCSDHRGVKEARSVNLQEFDYDFEQAWESQERLLKTVGFSSLRQCDDLLCLRHEANVKLHALRCYEQWYQVSLTEIMGRTKEHWVF